MNGLLGHPVHNSSIRSTTCEQTFMYWMPCQCYNHINSLQYYTDTCNKPGQVNTSFAHSQSYKAIKCPIPPIQ